MAEGEDRSQKTEEPTQKRLRDAREKGQVVSSREIDHWFMLLAGTIVLLSIGPSIARDIAAALADVFERLATTRAGTSALGAMAVSTLSRVGMALLPAAVLLAIAAVASSMVQHGPIASFDKLKPKLENISLIKGFERLFSVRSLVEFTKGILKFAIVAVVAVLMIAPEIGRISNSAALEPMQALDLIWRLMLRMLGGVVAIVTVIAGLDFLYQIFEFRKQMRMSKQEVKDELKQSEGDPMIKARLRQLRMERARKRMMAAVLDADVVITNPTHYATALKYDSDKMEAPRLVAKGVDAVARRIREVAEENEVPVVENPPLARALYASVEIDQEIPEAHYKVVAEVISYVWKLKHKMPRRRAR